MGTIVPPMNKKEPIFKAGTNVPLQEKERK